MRFRFNVQLITGKSVVGDWQPTTKEEFKTISQNARDGLATGRGSIFIVFENYPVTYTNQVPVAAIACLTIESRND